VSAAAGLIPGALQLQGLQGRTRNSSHLLLLLLLLRLLLQHGRCMRPRLAVACCC
jgi:hypothetical protein